MATPMRLPRPGAHPDDGGTRFTLVSEPAEKVELCIFDHDGNERRVEMEQASDDGRYTVVEEAGPGTRYGFRVHGPWDPARGLRCNPRKLLADPYARRMTGDVAGGAAVLDHVASDPSRPSRIDSAPATLRSVVTDPHFDWGDDRPPRTPLADTVVYETHVRGLTMRHPDVPPELQGTYAGLAHPAVVDHLRWLGVTAVELLPVHQFVHDRHLVDAGRRNYWGYNTVGFFAPHAGYAAGDDPVGEFKEMVRALHAAGLEVILDVVYNHTAEGNAQGPTLSLRGIDNPAYYRLDPADPSRYLNWTGTGNTVDLASPAALRLVMDSLRYWVTEMRVDGFRFDLATVLGRTRDDFDPNGGFFGAVAQDPVLDGVKLIAEPWDVGPGGYQVGGFPAGWSEWNDQYRDTVRDFWRAQPGSLAGFASRLTASSDLYEANGRPPTASVNLVTSHDGFTLADLVSYNERHNEANGEGNRDGHADNRSWNTGVEGPTDDPEVTELRARRMRSFLATLACSQGVPMLLGGDELGRTQGGNNNAYNQDNEISWYDWESADRELAEFTRRVLALRRAHPTFRRTAWLHEHPEPTADHVGWFTPSGEEMTVDDWNGGQAVSLYLDGGVVHCAVGETSDDDFLVMVNGSGDDLEMAIPATGGDDAAWRMVVDTADPDTAELRVDDKVEVAAFGMVVLHRPRS